MQELSYKHNLKDKNDKSGIPIELDKENKTQLSNEGITRRDSINKKAII